MKSSSIFLLILLQGIATPFFAQHDYQNRLPFRSEVIAKKGIAATSHPLATQTALDILKRGGNAIDAAIAANALLGLIEPTACGIGGDAFAVIWDAKTQRLYGINGSGKAPSNLSFDYFKKQKIRDIPSEGPLSLTVPGCVDTWQKMHEKFGKLSLEEILAPAIAYSDDGFPVSEMVAKNMALQAERLKKYSGFSKIYMPNDSLPKKGDLFKNPALANTYRRLAEAGLRNFYDGEIADEMVEYVKTQGGFLSVSDFNAYQSEWVQPLSTSYRGYELWQLPPNGQGIAIIEMLNILETNDIKSMGFGSKALIHLLIETKKLVSEDVSEQLGDPAFVNVAISKLISKAFAAERAKLINKEKAGKSVNTAFFEQGNSVFLTVADAEGNMVGLMQSNYRGMGSGLTPENLGFVLQNSAAAFTLQANHPNVYASGKRPLLNNTPSFVTKDGSPWLCFGWMDGQLQSQSQLQFLVNVIDFGMNLQEAGDAPMMCHETPVERVSTSTAESGWVNMDSGFNYEIIRGLMKMGHRVKFETGNYGGFQAIMRDPISGIYFGASESKKNGQAAGY
jgi:gamma-glutamyltranspeptidase/glutathione hydrolase